MSQTAAGNKYLDNGDDDSSDDDNDYNVHEVVRTGTFVEVKEVISRDRPRLVAVKDDLGRTVLHYAAELDRTKIALFLISKNSDVNARDNEERTPLHLAAGKGHTEMCRFLLEFQANIRLKDSHCWTALHHAVNGNHIDTATLLIKRGVDLHAEDHKYGRTALHLAAEKGFTELSEMLIIRGADLQAAGDAFFSKTPLHLAAINGHRDVALILLQRGADVNALSGLLDKSPLHFAIEKGHFEVVKVLLQYHADPNCLGLHTNGMSPLHLCALHNHFNIMDLLLHHKDIRVNIMGKFTTLGTPLHLACQYGFQHLVHLLIDYGADFSLVDENGHSPLHIACIHEHFDIVTLLIEKHANPNVLSLKKKTPIDCIQNAIIREKMYQLTLTMKKLKEEEEQEILKQKRIMEQKQLILSQQLTMQRQKEFEKNLLKEIRKNDFMKKLILICDKSGDANALVRLYEEYCLGKDVKETGIDINEPLILVSHIQNNPNYSSYRLPQVPAIPLLEGDGFMSNNSLLGYSGRAGIGGNGQMIPFMDDNSSITSLGSHGGEGTSTILTSNRLHANALTLSALRGFYELVQILLQWPGININIQELNGNTALHNSALIGSRDICELLLLHGADNGIVNVQGKSPANLTDRLSLQEVIRNPKLISQKRHLQNQILKNLIEKKSKVSQLEDTEGINAMASPQSADMKRRRLDGGEGAGGELTLKELLEEEKLLDQTKEMVTEFSSKNHFKNLPLIAPQFTNNILPQLQQKESTKLDLSQITIKPPFKSTAPAAGGGGGGLSLPEITPSKKSVLSSSSSLSLIPVSTTTNNNAPPMASPAGLSKRYGNLPETFGGNRSDFFHLKSFPKVAPSSTDDEKLILFSDLFSLQKSYLPTAFDSSKEWNQSKDFLWLFGYPSRGQVVSFLPPPPLLSPFHPNPHHPHQHSFHSYQPPAMPVPIEMEDRRSLVYSLAKSMNELQRLFSLPSDHLDFASDPLLQQHFTHSSILESLQQSSVHSANDPSQGHLESQQLPETSLALTEIGSSAQSANPFRKQLMEFLSFNNYCLFHHLSRKPIHIHAIDFEKLILFSNHCFVTLTSLLYFFHPKAIVQLYESYVPWCKEDYEYYHHPNIQPKQTGGDDHGTHLQHIQHTATTPFFEYRLYLLSEYEKEIYGLQAHFSRQAFLPDNFIQSLLYLLKHAMIQSYESFLAFYYGQYADQPRHQHHPQFLYEPPHVLQQRQQQQSNKKKTKPGKGTLKEDTSEEDRILSYEDPLKKEWSELIANPPRSLRSIVDVFFEISTQIVPILEKFYPNDFVRAHVWLVEANQLLDGLLEKERQKLIREEQLKQKIALLSAAQSAKDPLDEHDDHLDGANEGGSGGGGAGEEKNGEGSMLLTPLQCWLFDLELLEYENFFIVNGFKILEDFQELSHDDCYMYFPFLKIGDLRRLSKNILNLNDQMVKFYKKKCQKM